MTRIKYEKEQGIIMYIEENLKTEVNSSYDVAVCGGGIAGISAALASARNGKRTILFERQFMLGGLATAGLVTIYLPLCDGYGHQVSFGIAEELLRLSISDGAEGMYPDNWMSETSLRTEKDKRFEVQYNPQIFAVLTEKLLRDAGVDILYGTYIVSVNMKDNRIEHVVAENKSGRVAYQVKSVVDATGDCDIAQFAKAPTDTFKQGNILAAWYYSAGRNGYKLNMRGCADIPEQEKTEQGNVEYLSDRRFGGLDGVELSEMTCMSHQSVYQGWKERRAHDETLWPVTMATIPQVRMTRKIVGEYELAVEEMHLYFEDSIGMVSDWKKRGPVYEVPFRTLYSAKVKNLICAGRCTSVDQTMWDIMRVIPCCAVTGQAAGTAAAMSDDFTKLDVSKLQEQLKKDGVVLHEKQAEGIVKN